jgi:hypothetical protein
VLEGSGRESITFRYVNARGSEYQSRHPFEGIIPNMQRRWQETESNAVREELGKYQSIQPCRSCGGTRLNVAARNVFVEDRPLHEIASLGVATRLHFFEHLKLAGWRGEIADKIVLEIGSRLRFLADVGLGYLTLDRSADTLSGGEAQRIRLASQIGSGLVGVMYILDEPSIGLHHRDHERLLAHAVPAARSRQLGARRRARPRHHHGRRSRRGSRAGRRRAWRPGRGPGHAGRNDRQSRIADRTVSVRPPRRSAAEAAQRVRSEAGAESARRARQQPEERRL